MRLLPPESLLTTGPVDHADWNYRPLLSTITRARFQLVCELLPEHPVRCLLELGYGSGIFLPELALHCEELHGIDVHDMAGEVGQRLARQQVSATLIQGSAAAMPYEDDFFDRVVCISSLEFVEEIEAAVDELVRVLALGGRVICVTPGHSPIVDLGLKLLTGESAKRDYGGRRERLQNAVTRRFDVRIARSWPPLVGRTVPLYVATEFVPHGKH